MRGDFYSTKTQRRVPNPSWWFRKGSLEKGMFKMYFKGEDKEKEEKEEWG